MPRLARFLAGLVFCASVAGASTLTYTCDPTVDATAAGTCGYLNTTIAGLYTSTFTNISADIYVEQGITPLATNQIGESFVPYSSYKSALSSVSGGDAVDVAALAALNAFDSAVYGSDNVVITSALASALGFSGVGGLTASGANCAIGSDPGCYNGIIIVTTPANLASTNPGQSLYYRQSGGSITAGAFDYYSLVERETDEVLGTMSCVSTTGVLTDHCDAGTGASAGTGTPSAADLFRYNGVGTLAPDKASLGSLSAPTAYFSYNGGLTNGAGGALFNTTANNQSYADFTASCTWVQTAAGCLGQSPNITTDGNAEINMLNAVGYNLTYTPEPGTLALLGAGLAGACLRRYFCRA